MQKIQLPFMQYDSALPQLGQIASTQASFSYAAPARPAVSPFCDLGLNPTSQDGVYMQWPSATMMYSHSYDQFRHAVFQVNCISYLIYYARIKLMRYVYSYTLSI